MIKNSIAKFLDAREITPYRLFIDAGIARGTAYNLYNLPDKIPSGEVLDRICTAYSIQPGEILYWEKNDEN